MSNLYNKVLILLIHKAIIQKTDKDRSKLFIEETKLLKNT